MHFTKHDGHIKFDSIKFLAHVFAKKSQLIGKKLVRISDMNIQTPYPNYNGYYDKRVSFETDVINGSLEYLQYQKIFNANDYRGFSFEFDDGNILSVSFMGDDNNSSVFITKNKSDTYFNEKGAVSLTHIYDDIVGHELKYIQILESDDGCGDKGGTIDDNGDMFVIGRLKLIFDNNLSLILAWNQCVPNISECNTELLSQNWPTCSYWHIASAFYHDGYWDDGKCALEIFEKMNGLKPEQYEYATYAIRKFNKNQIQHLWNDWVLHDGNYGPDGYNKLKSTIDKLMREPNIQSVEKMIFDKNTDYIKSISRPYPDIDYYLGKLKTYNQQLLFIDKLFTGPVYNTMDYKQYDALITDIVNHTENYY